MTNVPAGPTTVQWAFVVGVDSSGNFSLIDHDRVTDVRAKRVATLDDINAACVVASRQKSFAFWPGNGEYSVAFLVFQVPTGFIAASDNIFENIIPLSNPSDAQVLGAFGVLQNQITAERAANLAAQVAVSSTLSFLKQEAEKAMDPDAPKKTPGGLIRV